jgi:hypothetical protein
MNQPSTPVRRSSSNSLFFISLAVFVVSACAIAFFIKLDRHIESTCGKVISTYSKRMITRGKKAYDQEYLVVRYLVGGKEYKGETMRRTSGDFVTAYYYSAFPGMVWFTKNGNSNIVFCAIVMMLSLIGMVMGRPGRKKPRDVANVKVKQKKT